MERKKIIELIALYELEPDLKQIWVEGVTDKRVLQRYIFETEIEGVKVGSIDNVDVPKEIVEKYGLTSSNRNRNIALALELEAGINQKNRHAELMCVVDLDFDDYINGSILGKYIYYTDFTTFEMYLFDEEIITKFIQLMAPGFSRPTKELMDNLSQIGSALFSVKAANELLGWKMSLPDPLKLLSSDKNLVVEFDKDEFVDRALQASTRTNSKAELEQAIKECLDKQPEDPRKKMRGHDFIDLFHFTLKKTIRPKEAGKSSALIPGYLIMAAKLSNLSEYNLFRELNKKFAS
ncbi:DUF4435 domain-containing protein [uncultured Roseibium sp.]|uniref:DUF4435 domain-containing protein n=1 Tax=uncultured Roseibium sp. TaxID=1936171 RepID=UPI002601DE4D|nr:DUF4435 domain-containing protein [uncultured Roseibium sp.]